MAIQIKVATAVDPLYWFHITGLGADTFDGKDKEFKVTLVQTPERATALLVEARELYEANTQDGFTAKSMGDKRCTANGVWNKESGTHISFGFKTRTTYPDGKSATIKIYDEHGEESNMDGGTLGNGTTGSVLGILKYYRHDKSKTDGVSFFLVGLQIFEKVAYVSKKPSFGNGVGTFVGVGGGLDVPTPQPSGFMDHNSNSAEAQGFVKL